MNFVTICIEIMVPRVVLHRITHPVVVHAFNLAKMKQQLRQGEILFVQRAGGNQTQRMRSISHLAIQNLVLSPGDCILRHGSKFPNRSIATYKAPTTHHRRRTASPNSSRGRFVARSRGWQWFHWSISSAMLR